MSLSVGVVIGYRTDQLPQLDLILAPFGADVTVTRGAIIPTDMMATCDGALRVGGLAWPLVAFAAVASTFRITFDAKFPEAAAVIMKADAFHSVALNEVQLPPQSDSHRVFIVSTLLRGLISLWLPKAVVDKELRFLPLFRYRLGACEEIFYLVRMPPGPASRCAALAEDLRHPWLVKDELRPSLYVTGLPHDKVTAALGRFLQPTVRFTISKDAPSPPAATEVKPVTLLRAGADPANPTTTYVNRGDFGSMVFEASTLIGRLLDAQRDVIDQLRRSGQPTTVDGIGRLRVGQVALSRNFSEVFIAAMGEALVKVGEFGIMWPADRAGFPKSWYLVRKEALNTNSSVSLDMDVLLIDSQDKALVRFGTAAARAALIAESRFLLEREIFSDQRGKFRLPFIDSRPCDPRCALAWMKDHPVIAIDSRETRMKDDCFQIAFDAATNTVKMTCFCATPITEADLRNGFLSSALWREAFDRIVSTHDGRRKVDMISNPAQYSLSYFHAKCAPRRVLAVTAHFDPRLGLRLVEDGPLAPTLRIVDDIVLDVELSFGMVDMWGMYFTDEFRGCLKALDDHAEPDVSDVVCSMLNARPSGLMQCALPTPIHHALLLLLAVNTANGLGHSTEASYAEREENKLASKVDTEVQTEGRVYRLRVKPSKPFSEISDFKFLPNRVFAHVVTKTIADRHNVCLFESTQETFDEATSKGLRAVMASRTDSLPLRVALLSDTCRHPTRTEFRAILRSLPGASAEATVSDALPAAGLASIREVATFALGGKDDLASVRYQSRVVVEWEDLHLLFQDGMPQPVTFPRSVLGGTSALRRCEHLLAQFLAVSDVVDTEAVKSIITEICGKLTTAAEAKRDQNVGRFFDYLKDVGLPADQRRLPLKGIVSVESGKVWLPAMDAMAVVDGTDSLPPPLCIVQVCVSVTDDGVLRATLATAADVAALPFFSAWQRTFLQCP